MNKLAIQRDIVDILSSSRHMPLSYINIVNTIKEKYRINSSEVDEVLRELKKEGVICFRINKPNTEIA